MNPSDSHHSPMVVPNNQSPCIVSIARGVITGEVVAGEVIAEDVVETSPIVNINGEVVTKEVVAGEVLGGEVAAGEVVAGIFHIAGEVVPIDVVTGEVVVKGNDAGEVVGDADNNTEIDIPCPNPNIMCQVTQFSLSLIRYDEVSWTKCFAEVRGMGVTSFDTTELLKKCSLASPNYDATLCNFDLIYKIVFTVGQIWFSRDLLHRSLSSLAKLHGWKPRKDCRTICCNRFAKKRLKKVSEHERQRKKSKEGVEEGSCEFQITAAPLVKSRRKNEAGYLQYTPDWNKPCVIKEASLLHCGDCAPGQGNLLAVTKSSGTYTKHIPQRVLFQLCNQQEMGTQLTYALVHAALRPVWPKHKVVSGKDVANIRLKVMRCLPVFRLSSDFEAFQNSVKDCSLLGGLDDQVMITDDEAYELAHSACAKVLKTECPGGDSVFSILEFFEVLSSRAKGFTYEKISSNGTGKKKLLGLLWMTATMRRNLELYGDYMCFDMMARGIMSLLWSYTAIALYDEMRHICIGLEGFVCGERFDMYCAMASFIGKHAPRRKLSSVLIVSGDGFFDKESVTRMGFCNAAFIADRHHLLNSGVKKMFGKITYDLIKTHLVRMVQADSKQKFDQLLMLAKRILMTQHKVDGQAEADLALFSSLRAVFANYCIAELPGNRGRLGNVACEINHSSVLSFLNDGHSKTNGYMESPIVVIRDLMKRQQKHILLTNKLLFSMKQKMMVEKMKLAEEPDTDDVLDLRLAASELSFVVYERYKKRRCRTEEYRRSTSEQTVIVQSLLHSDAPPRIFTGAGDRCGCQGRTAELEMCVHEIVAYNGYQRGLFLDMHFVRSCVGGSLHGWVPPVNNIIDEIMGIQPEVMDTETLCLDSLCSAADVLSPPIRTQVPCGSLPVEQGVTPLSKHQVENILQVLVASYSSYSSDRQYEVSNLVVQMQEIVTRKGSVVTTLMGPRGDMIDVPERTTVAQTGKKRKKPRSEKLAHVQTTKLNTSIQRLGLSQEITGSEYSIVANPSKKIRHCQFCNQDHRYTICNTMEKLCTTSTVHLLTSDHPTTSEMLIARLKMCMPVVGNTIKDKCFCTIEKTTIGKNFIIHAACEEHGRKRGHIESLKYHVTFLGKDGQGVEDRTSIWINGETMSKMVHHNLKKIKFVFDETMFRKEGWIDQDMTDQY